MKRIIKIIALVAIVLPAFATKANAALLEGGNLSMSTSKSGTSANHTITFTKSGAATIGKIIIQYCKQAGSDTTSCTSTGASDNGSLTSLSVDGTPETGSWSDSWDTNRYVLTHATDSSGSGADQEYIIVLGSVDNPLYTACDLTAPGDGTTGTCFVRLFTYLESDDDKDTGIVDSTNVTMTITQPVSVSARVDPIFTLSVAAVSSAQTPQSGGSIATDVASTVTTIPFGNLTPGTEKYAAHTLTVISNTVGGYSVDAFMEANLTGQAYTQDIDPFAGTGVTATNPIAWVEPDGSTAGTDTGWLGVSTDDAGAASGNGAADLFFPLDTDGQEVVYSSQTTLSDEINVLYAIEVNSLQAADNYTGTLIYDALPVY